MTALYTSLAAAFAIVGAGCFFAAARVERRTRAMLEKADLIPAAMTDEQLSELIRRYASYGATPNPRCCLTPCCGAAGPGCSEGDGPFAVKTLGS